MKGGAKNQLNHSECRWQGDQVGTIIRVLSKAQNQRLIQWTGFKKPENLIIVNLQCKRVVFWDNLSSIEGIIWSPWSIIDIFIQKHSFYTVSIWLVIDRSLYSLLFAEALSPKSDWKGANPDRFGEIEFGIRIRKVMINNNIHWRTLKSGLKCVVSNGFLVNPWMA